MYRRVDKIFDWKHSMQAKVCSLQILLLQTLNLFIYLLKSLFLNYVDLFDYKRKYS
jgi:hypothetical protein